MADADFSLGAGGTTTWERCFLGLPSVLIAVARNQTEIIKNLADMGIVWNLGYYEEVSTEDILAALRKAIENPGAIKKMSDGASNLMCKTVLGQGILINSIMNQSCFYKDE